jgi:hypothetical protein
MSKEDWTPEKLADYIKKSTNQLMLSDIDRLKLIDHFYKNEMTQFMQLVMGKSIENGLVNQDKNIVLTELAALYADQTKKSREYIETMIVGLADTVYKMSPLFVIKPDVGSSSF